MILYCITFCYINILYVTNSNSSRRLLENFSICITHLLRHEDSLVETTLFAYVYYSTNSSNHQCFEYQLYISIYSTMSKKDHGKQPIGFITFWSVHDPLTGWSKFSRVTHHCPSFQSRNGCPKEFL